MRMYRHFKGGHYQHLSDGFSADDAREVVVYRSMTDGKVWVRDKEEFYGQVERDGKTMPRFQRIPTASVEFLSEDT